MSTRVSECCQVVLLDQIGLIQSLWNGYDLFYYRVSHQIYDMDK